MTGGAVADLLFDPSTPLLAYSAGDGFYKTLDGGGIWAKGGEGLPSVRIVRLVRAPANLSGPPLWAPPLWASNGRNLFASRDNGRGFYLAAQGPPDGATTFAIVRGPTGVRAFAAGGGDSPIFRSDDNGGHWTPLFDGPRFVTTLESPAGNENTIYAARSAREGTRPDILRTTDGGVVWRSLALAAAAGFRDAAVTRVLLDPFDPATLYVATLGDGVFRTTDAGETWNQPTRLAGLRVEALAADPRLRGHLFAGTPGSVFESTDGGGSWSPIGGGLPAERITAVSVSADGSLLLAGTASGSIFRLGLSTGSGAIIALVARGDAVYAAAEGRGLLASADAGGTFRKIPDVVCPFDSVRDVAFGANRLYAECGDLRSLWTWDGSAWSLRSSFDDPSYGDPPPAGDVGRGRPLLAEDPLEDRAPTWLTGVTLCDYEGCYSRELVRAGDSIVTLREVPRESLFRFPRLLAPPVERSPWLLSIRNGTVYRTPARNRPVSLGFATSQDSENLGAAPDDILGLARDIQVPIRLVAAGKRGAWLSGDEGRTWRLAAGVPAGVAAVAADPALAGRALAASGATLYESIDAGASFHEVHVAPAAITALAIDEADPSRVFLGLENGSVRSVRLLHSPSDPAGAPSILTVREEGQMGFRIAFAGRAEGVASYALERRALQAGAWSRVDTARLIPGVFAGSFLDSNPPPDTPLLYRVIAEDATGFLSVSVERRAVRPTTPPLPPDELVAREDDRGWRLTWNDRSGREDGYLVEHLSTGGGWRPLLLLPADSTSYRVEESPVSPRFLRVRAVNARGRSEPALAVSAGGSPPRYAATLSAFRGDGLNARISASYFSYTESTEVVYERSVDDGAFEEIARGVPSYLDSDRQADHNYVYRARAVNPAGYGPPSETVSLGTWTTVPRAPEDVTAAYERRWPRGAADRITINWRDVSGREDGFAAAMVPIFNPPIQARFLGNAGRNQTTTEALLYWGPDGMRGDQLVTVRAFNGLGYSEPSAPFRLRIFEGFGDNPDELFRLLPFVAQGRSDGSVITTDIVERVSSKAWRGSDALQFLDTPSDSLFVRAETGSQGNTEGSLRVLDDFVASLRQAYPLLPSGDPHSGPMARFSDRHTGAPHVVRVRRNVTLPDGRRGQAGVVYTSVPIDPMGILPLVLPALADDETHRSSVGLVHLGIEPEPLVLRVTVFDGESGKGSALPDVFVEQGSSTILDRVLEKVNARQGWVRVERISGPLSFYAYAIVTDTLTSDGAWVSPFALGADGPSQWVLPVQLEGDNVRSEVVLTNTGSTDLTFDLVYRESLPAARSYPPVRVRLAAGRQVVLPSLPDLLRLRGMDLGVPGSTLRIGIVRISSPDGGDARSLAAGVRLKTADGGFSCFTQAVEDRATTEASERPGTVVTRVWGLREREGDHSEVYLANLSDQTVDLQASVHGCLAMSWGNGQRRCTPSAAVTPISVQIPAGGVYRMERPLASIGASVGWLETSRTQGAGSVYAFGLLIDDVTGDVGFVAGAAGTR